MQPMAVIHGPHRISFLARQGCNLAQMAHKPGRRRLIAFRDFPQCVRAYRDPVGQFLHCQPGASQNGLDFPRLLLESANLKKV